jgi:acetyl esterase/lipase
MVLYLTQLSLIAAALTTSGWLTDLTLWKPSHEPGGEVRRVSGVSYCDGPRESADRHRLDLFLPKDRQNYPVIVLVHGGAWLLGDNRCCGLYSSVGEFLASRGIGVVLPNYRLSPQVKHPEHVKDVAKAVAWTHRHIAEYGGNADQLFLVGHSAGGHLVALLATDEKYLKAEGLNSGIIRGVIGVSGVYHIPPGSVEATLGGSFRLDQLFPLRGPSSKVASWGGVPLHVNVYGAGFGDDAKVRADASPINHVRPGLPPFLLVNAENELPTLAGMTEEFSSALKKSGCEFHRLMIKERNHNSVLFCVIQSSDPLAQAMEAFVVRCSRDR